MAGILDLLRSSGILGGTPGANAPLAPGSQPQGILGGLSQRWGDNSGAILALAAGLGQGRNMGEGLARGAAAMPQGMMADLAGRKERKGQAALSEFMGSPEAKALSPGMRKLMEAYPELAVKMAGSTLTPPTSDDIREYEYAKRQGDPRTFAEYMKEKRATSGSIFGTPIYGKNEAGETVLGAMTKDGEFKPITPPAGVKYTPGVQNLDLGTSYQPVNSKTGEVAGAPLSKDVAGKAAQTAAGTSQGQTAAALPTAMASGDRLVRAIDSAMNDPALANVTGPIDSRLPTFRAETARAESKVKQVLGGTFLQAYNDLRGAGAITEKEGEAAQNAYNRLQSTNMGDADYKEALLEFRQEVVKLMEVAKARAAQPALGQGAPPMSEWQDLGGGVRIRQKP